MSWELAVVGAVAVLGVLGLIVLFAKGEKSEAKSSAVAKDDLDERIEQDAAEQVYHDAAAVPPPIREALDELELARLKRAEERAGKAQRGPSDA